MHESEAHRQGYTGPRVTFGSELGRFACTLHSKGFDDEYILDCVLHANVLDDDEYSLSCFFDRLADRIRLRTMYKRMYTFSGFSSCVCIRICIGIAFAVSSGPAVFIIVRPV